MNTREVSRTTACAGAPPARAAGGEAGTGSGDGDQPAAELAALRARVREVEVALGLPARPGQPTPPALPALLRRVAALERRAGIVPGLVPLPGCGAATSPGAADVTTEPPRSRRQVWRDRGQVALALALVVALCAWLLRPTPGGGDPAVASDAAPTPPRAGVPVPAGRLAPPPGGRAGAGASGGPESFGTPTYSDVIPAPPPPAATPAATFADELGLPGTTAIPDAPQGTPPWYCARDIGWCR